MKYLTVNVYDMKFRDSDGNIVTADDVLGIEDPIDIDIELDEEPDDDFDEDSNIRAAIETAIDEIADEENGFREFELYSFEYTVYDV